MCTVKFVLAMITINIGVDFMLMKMKLGDYKKEEVRNG